MNKSQRIQDRSRLYVGILTSVLAWLRLNSDGGSSFRKALSGLERIVAGLRNGKTVPAPPVRSSDCSTNRTSTRRSLSRRRLAKP